MTAFERDSAVTRTADGRYAARVEPAWRGGGGPHGGYLGAIVVRAMQAELEARDALRPLRSITLHYLRPPEEAPLAIVVAVERAGRNLWTLSARAGQGDEPSILAIAAFARDFRAADRGDYAPPRMPDAPRPEDVARLGRHGAPQMAAHFDLRPCVGPMPFSGADEARSGGWIAFTEAAQPYDAPALVLIADIWLPSPWTRFDGPGPAPTVDLTVHLRAPEHLPRPPLLGIYESRMGHGGFFDESGEIWSADGVLVAQSRQLALLRP